MDIQYVLFVGSTVEQQKAPLESFQALRVFNQLLCVKFFMFSMYSQGFSNGSPVSDNLSCTGTHTGWQIG